MAETRKLYRDDDYLARFDGMNDFADGSPANGVQLGYYQRANLEDMINNFMVAYVGQDKVLTKVPRHEVAFWAQRAVQEFSYDIFHADKNIELEVNPTTLQVALPQDFVSLVKVIYTSDSGQEYTAYRSQRTNAAQAILQDDEYQYEYDMAGDILYAEDSEGVKRWMSRDIDQDNARNYYYGSTYDGEYNYYSYYRNQGRRYGLDPKYNNQNLEYILDLEQGVIYFGSKYSDLGEPVVSLRYVSDGLAANGDLSTVYVPKLAEDAVYASMLYNLSKLRPSSAQIAPLYKKEASAKMRNAKIRLQDYKLEEMTQVMRGKSKWIKH